MMKISAKAKELSIRLGCIVDPEPYIVGTAMRRAGEPRPKSLPPHQVELWAGWDAADRQMRAMMNAAQEAPS